MFDFMEAQFEPPAESESSSCVAIDSQCPRLS